ncbi:MAG: hypothetical protein ACF8NJ_02625 [Phycisphaerales bacterium JB038]
MRENKTIIAAMSLAALTLLPSLASAQLYEMRYNGSSFVDGTYHNSRYYAYVNGQYKRMYVGMLNLKYAEQGSSDWKALPTYCIQPDQYLNLPNTYHVEELANVVQDADSIARLWDAKYEATLPTWDDPNRGLEAAAFQTLVWEYAKDGDFDLTKGSFRLDMNHSATATVAALASSWYTELANWSGKASLAALVSPNSQNELTVMPAPAGPLLSFVGLAGGAVVLRRRRG